MVIDLLNIILLELEECLNSKAADCFSYYLKFLYHLFSTIILLFAKITINSTIGLLHSYSFEVNMRARKCNRYSFHASTSDIWSVPTIFSSMTL